MEVVLVMSFSEPPLASTVLGRGVGGGVSPREIAPVEPRAGSSKRVHRPARSTRGALLFGSTERRDMAMDMARDDKVGFEALSWKVCGGRV